MSKKFLVIFFLFLLSICLKIPFTSKVLYCWDSVQFALGVENYNVSLYQPHPPGYILYVMLAKVSNYLFNDINYTLNFISILFSAFAVVFLYLLGEKMYNRTVGITSSLFLLFSPLYWFNSVVALPYAAECFFSVLVAYFCWISLSNKKYIILSTIFLAVAFGIRQNLILFLLPLWGYSIKKSIPLLLYSGVLFLLCLASLIPMVYLSGGWESYLRAMAGQSSYILSFSIFQKGITALINNTTQVLTSIFFGGLGATSFLLIPYVAKRVVDTKRIIHEISISNLQFFSLWIFPSFLFYCLVFIDPPAYILTFLPAIIIVFAVMLNKVASYVQNISLWSKNKVIIVLLGIIILINSLIFTLSFPAVIKKNNSDWETTSKIVRENFTPTETIIITSLKREKNIPNYFRHFMYYLHNYRVLFLPEIEGNKDKKGLLSFKKKSSKLLSKNVSNTFIFEIPRGVNYIVIGDDYLEKYCKIKLYNIQKIYFIKTENKRALIFKKHFFTLK